MSTRRRSIRFGFFLAVLWLGAYFSGAQAIFVGVAGLRGGPVAVTGVETFIQTGYGATRDGVVNVAVFDWSQAPCPGAAKIKFFRFSNTVPGGEFIYLGQRGPFDVTSTYQIVRLDPEVPLHSGDLIAITNLTSCGGPVTAVQIDVPSPLPLRPLPPYYAVPGDVTSNIFPATPVPTSGPAVLVDAIDVSLTLLHGRFRMTLLATNPRTGAVVQGYPVSIGNDSSGYFSLPDFTNNSSLPEVVVKMVDATGSPALGDDFWFFHAPLTDVQYTITVKDQRTGAVKTYSNTSASPGQLCGAVDTSAFPP